MKLWLSVLLGFSICVFSVFSRAVVETYQFDDESLRQRYQQFVEELRCPKCQNQNLSGSNSPIAEDLRRELYRLLNEGRSDTEVVDYMVARYGDFILYRPRLNTETAILWFAPAIFLLLGVLIMVTIFRRQYRAGAAEKSLEHSPLEDSVLDRSQKHSAQQDEALDATEQKQLQRLLSEQPPIDEIDRENNV